MREPKPGAPASTPHHRMSYMFSISSSKSRKRHGTSSVFIHPLVISISYCLDVLFECGRTRGLEGTCLKQKNDPNRPSTEPRFQQARAASESLASRATEYLLGGMICIPGSNCMMTSWWPLCMHLFIFNHIHIYIYIHRFMCVIYIYLHKHSNMMQYE